MVSSALRKLALPLLLAASSCDGGMTAPEAGLSFAATISDATIAPSETATLTFRVRNVSRVPRAVDVSCDVTRLRIDDDEGENHFPGDRSIICSLVLSVHTLRQGEQLTRTFTVAGASASNSAILELPTGRYAASLEFRVARAGDKFYSRVRSADVHFEVTP